MLAKLYNGNGIYPNLKPKQRRLANLLVNPEEKRSISELCQEVKISRTTFYNWLNTEADFKNYLDFLIEGYTNSELANVWKATIKRAVNGDVQAQKLYFELKNKYKQEINVSAGVVFISGEDEIEE